LSAGRDLQTAENLMAFDGRTPQENIPRKHPKRKPSSMQNLSPRHVKIEESLRLGVESGWYSTKVSGTFVSGPHDTMDDCLLRIAELDPPPTKRRRD
jgi:hypothetical protein